jgi:hypothetical protein
LRQKGVWYPFQSGDIKLRADDSSMSAKRSAAISRMLVETIPGTLSLIHVDASEQHRALDKKSEPFAEFMSEMRFWCRIWF